MSNITDLITQCQTLAALQENGSEDFNFACKCRTFPFAELATALENTRSSIQEREIKCSVLKQHLIDMSNAISRFIHKEGSEEELEQAIDDLGEETYLIDDAKECERLRVLLTKEREERDALRAELAQAKDRALMYNKDMEMVRRQRDEAKAEVERLERDRCKDCTRVEGD